MARYTLSALLCVMLGAGAALSQQTTVFTYQGQLTDAAQPANGNFDLQFALFGNASGGTQIGSTQTVSAVPVTGGVFTVQLDFGVSAFPGANRFLEIGVQPAGGSSFTTLAPRQQISSTPYAIRTLSAATADALSSACVGCVQDTQILSVAGSKVSGTIPAASVPAGSGNYVQNTTTQQANSNFNIAGNGVVGGNLTVAGTLNANVTGNFVQNRTTQQANANFDISGDGTLGGTLSASAVGIGTTTPQSALDVKGTGWFDGDSTPLPAGAGKGVGIGFLNSAAAGYVFAYDYGTGTPHNLLLNIPGGNVGIGTLSPSTKLEVDGGSGDGVYGVSTSARGVVGSSQGQAGVVGVSNSFDGVFGVSHDMNNAGVFGTNDSPTGGFGVAGVSTNGAGTQGNSTGGRGVAGISNTGYGVYGQTGAAHTVSVSGVYGNSSGDGGVGVIGEADVGNAWGVYGTSTSPTGVGVYGRNVSGGVAMEAEGDASQIRTAGGWVKAMVLVNLDGTIARCYNSQTGLTNSNCPAMAMMCCGIKVQHPHLGRYYVDFGLVTDRFYSVQPINTGSELDVYAELYPPGSAFVDADGVLPSANQLLIFMGYVATQNLTDSPLVIVVF